MNTSIRKHVEFNLLHLCIAIATSSSSVVMQYLYLHIGQADNNRLQFDIVLHLLFQSQVTSECIPVVAVCDHWHGHVMNHMQKHLLMSSNIPLTFIVKCSSNMMFSTNLAFVNLRSITFLFRYSNTTNMHDTIPHTSHIQSWTLIKIIIMTFLVRAQ